MQITVIGPGHIGANLAERFARAGHDITLTFFRDRASVDSLAREIRAGVVDAPAEAVIDAELVVLSVPWGAIPAAIDGVDLEGKIVIDTTNQFGAGPHPEAGETAAAFNARRLVGSRYTKSFNTLTSAFQVSAAGRPEAERVVQWLCGDDGGAKAVVSELITAAGYVPVDVGGTADCAVMEAPRRPGAVYGEEYRLTEALEVLDALRAGRPIPPVPSYAPA